MILITLMVKNGLKRAILLARAALRLNNPSMPITPVPSQTKRVHIHEVINRTRLESLLVVTALSGAQVVARLKTQPPSEAGFWQISDDIGVETLGEHMTEHSAEEFLRAHLDHMQSRTWRFRVWRP